MHFAPHLLLRADEEGTRAAALLRAAGYIVSRVDDDALAEQLAGAAHVDGVVIELPAVATIHFGRRLAARYGGATLLVLAITAAAPSVQRAIPGALTLTPRQVEDDLVSTVDLALAKRPAASGLPPSVRFSNSTNRAAATASSR